MFIHGKNNYVCYSVREKINYYKKVINGKINASPKTKRKAKLRLKTLEKINRQSYNEPRLIITDDTHFGNSMSKPRLCVAYGEDNKGRIFAYPIHNRKSKVILIDNNLDRQIENNSKRIDKSDVYETKYINGIKPLSKSTKKIIKHIHG